MILRARTAGELLLRVKAELPHSEFLPWWAENCEVSERQAQRYMRAAQGRPLPLRKIALPEKFDAASDLNALLPHDFEPSPVHFMLAVHGDAVYCIEPSGMAEPARSRCPNHQFSVEVASRMVAAAEVTK